jgi:hypothetical protein
MLGKVVAPSGKTEKRAKAFQPFSSEPTANNSHKFALIGWALLRPGLRETLKSPRNLKERITFTTVNPHIQIIPLWFPLPFD